MIKPEERALLTRLVDIMVALELRFVQEKSEEGQVMYRLEPCVHPIPSFCPANTDETNYRPIDTFVTYEGKRAADISVSRYAVRHLVAVEVSVLASRGNLNRHEFMCVDRLTRSWPTVKLMRWRRRKESRQPCLARGPYPSSDPPARASPSVQSTRSC